MKALFALISANFEKALAVAAFLPLIFWMFPYSAYAYANEGQITALVFDINSNKSNQNLVSYDQLVQSDPLVNDLLAYLQSKGSPLADRDTVIKILSHTELTNGVPVWIRALAISRVESNMCLHEVDNNCSGIGGENLKAYDSYADWFDDMSNLLLKPNYQNRPIEKYLHFYVQPGSLSWLHGVQQTEKDLLALNTQAQQESLALANPAPLTAASNAVILAEK